MIKKTFVLDTNVLLHNSNSIESFADNTVILPMPVIEELDKFKSNNDELGRNARQVIRHLDRLRQRGRLGEGVVTDGGGVVRIVSESSLPAGAGLSERGKDNAIIGVAFHLQSNGERIIFVSKDINARIKSDALGIETMDFEKQKVNSEELFTGFRTECVPRSVIEEFHRQVERPAGDLSVMPNEFVIFEAEEDPKLTALARVTPDRRLVHLSNKCENAWSIGPRSKEQRMALELLMDENVALVTLVGMAGTGKTLLALAAGLEQVIKMKRYDKMLVSRPIMPLGKDIGFLPGDKDSKLTSWMQPIFDNLAYLLRNEADAKHPVRERLLKLQRDHVVEMEALTYIRGRSISKQYVVVDEAQNLTPHEIKTIVSRAGDGTKMILTGDPSQIDTPYLDSDSNGLSYAVERLKPSPISGHVTLTKSERSTLAAVAADRL